MGNKKTKKMPKRIPEEDNSIEKTKKYKMKSKRKIKLKMNLKRIVLIALLIIIIIAGIVIGKVFGLCRDAKLSMEQLVIKYDNSIVKDIEGETIAVLSGDENRENVTMAEMSEYLPKAFVAIEDERFYEHKGVDIKRTGAATVTYLLHAGKSSFGGSTITQQLIKNLTEENERSWKRKVKEMSRAYYLEKELSKTEILELYLNLIFLGGRAYGVQVASQYYFSKSAQDLTLVESAFLAGINNSPNLYSPFSEDEDDVKQIKRRTKIVLDKMYELGKEGHQAGITEEEYNNAIAELENGIVFNRGTIIQNVYSYHTDAAITEVKKDLKTKYPDWKDEYIDYYVRSGGLTIYTTQNTEFQKLMEEEAKKDKYVEYSKYQVDEEGNPISTQSAMVLIDHKTGYVLATIGGIGEKTTSFGLNRATQTIRQPGSTMKPLAVLTPGIDCGIITAATVYDDIPYSSGKYYGYKDYGSTYTGLTTLRHNTAQSKNIPMLKAINDIGMDKSVEYVKNMGITTLVENPDMTLALGSNEISPLQVGGAYATIANDGVYIEPTFYTKVEDSNGNIVLETEQETRTVMSTATAYIIKEILTEVVRSGAGGYAGISGISVGVKTGTSNDDADRWFCGFTPYYTAAAWTGYDKNRETVRSTSNPSGKLWDAVMETIHKDLPNAKFSDTRPNNVTTATICKSSGLIATEICNNDPRGNQVYTEYFIKGTVPRETCTCHVQVDICTETGKLAGEYCQNRESKVFITRPETETGNWQRAKDAEYMLPTEYCTVHVTPPEEPTPEQEGTVPQGENNTTQVENTTQEPQNTEPMGNVIIEDIPNTENNNKPEEQPQANNTPEEKPNSENKQDNT